MSSAQVSPIVSLHACNRLRSILLMRRSPIIIGIAGDSGSGKTTYTDGIRRLLGPSMVTTIEMDGYHTEDRAERLRTGHMPLDPHMNRLSLLTQHLAAIKHGDSVDIPVYDHSSGTFGKPRRINPTPVIILEGLHALYDQFLPFLDYTIFVDPDRSIKYRWKYRRDVTVRGHSPELLSAEMVAREALYKRYIDFQKISATTVIKIQPSEMEHYAAYEYIGPDTADAYHITIIYEKQKTPLSSLPFSLNLSSLAGNEEEAFLLATAPSRYWGKKTTTLTLDGFVPESATDELLSFITGCTGVPADETLSKEVFAGYMPSIQFAQLLIAWTFLERAYHLKEDEAAFTG